MSITRSICSSPSMRSQGAASRIVPFRYAEARPNNVSLMSVDLPEPDTPVTHVNRASGISAVRLRRLLPVAPTMRSTLLGSNGERRVGSAILRLPLKYWPVIDAALARISRGVPWATMWPP